MWSRKWLIGILNWFYILKFSDMERDYTRQENVENEELATFVVTTQLMVNYSHVKENWETL